MGRGNVLQNLNDSIQSKASLSLVGIINAMDDGLAGGRGGGGEDVGEVHSVCLCSLVVMLDPALYSSSIYERHPVEMHRDGQRGNSIIGSSTADWGRRCYSCVYRYTRVVRLDMVDRGVASNVGHVEGLFCSLRSCCRRPRLLADAKSGAHLGREGCSPDRRDRDAECGQRCT